MTLYYATARKGRHALVLAGPFAHHRDARAATKHARVALRPLLAPDDHFDVGWGTAASEEVLPAKFHAQLGLRLDEDGLVDVKPGEVWRIERRRRSRAAHRRRALALHARSFCGWCGSLVPERRRHTNLNNRTPSFCDHGCASSYYT